MQCKDISFPSPAENILYDDALLNLAEQGVRGETLRFWESQQVFIVLGRTGRAEDDIDLEKARQDKIPILRRRSGGGTVVQGPGCLNYALILSKAQDRRLDDLRKSYQIILGKVAALMQDLGADIAFRPVSDIILVDGERKFSGNAQRRRRTFLLHHGTLLYDFDLSLIPRYLKMPKEIPAYRRQRLHLDFVTNVPFPALDIKRAFQERFAVQTTATHLAAAERKELDALLQARSCTEKPDR